MTDAVPTYTGVTRAQSTILIGWGIVLWFGAAVLTQLVGRIGAYEGLGPAILYALIIPGTVPFVYLTRTLARLRPSQTAVAMAIVTATALLFDGVAFAGLRALYWHEATSAAASIFWGAGVAIALGIAMNARD